MSKIAYVKVRVEIQEKANAADVISHCDYSFEHENITKTEIIDIEEK